MPLNLSALRKTLYTCLLAFIGIFLSHHALATHIRGGDLVVSRVDTGDPSVLRYRIVATIYRDTDGVEPQDGLIDFGDGTTPVIVSPPDRSTWTLIAPGTQEIIYEIEHTFPSAGVYSISYFERNRNEGVRNMFASGQTPFFIISTVVINPELGLNKTPVFQVPPIDEACVGQQFTHNPGAFDEEGDSLSYELTICKQSRGLNVVDYDFPDEFGTEQEDGTVPDFILMDPETGTLTWNAPGVPGEYNLAFFVTEWRRDPVSGILRQIGRINRDMQIVVRDCNNLRPRLNIPKDTCIVANQFLRDTIKATDADGDVIALTIEKHVPDNNNTTNRSVFRDIINTPAGEASGVFEWQPSCEDVRSQYYQAVFKAKESRTDGLVALADIQVYRVKVVGPSPEGLTAVADQANATIQLDWSNYVCPNASSMQIWRRKGSFDFPLDTCSPGIPAGSGYELIDDVPITQTSFLDDNSGLGLERGTDYCYRLVAQFPAPAGGESLASIEVCQFIESIAPYLLEVSVTNTSDVSGEIDLTWTKPVNVDVALFPKPWTYQIARYDGQLAAQNRTIIPLTFSEDDTTFTDSGLDTENQAYSYRILFSSQNNLVDSSQSASSVRLTPTPLPGSIQLDWTAETPWNNRDNRYPFHYIYREIPSGSGTFTLIDSVETQVDGFTYTDDGSFNGQPLLETVEYCYYVTTVGSYDQDFLRDSLPNDSQIGCTFILDSLSPCPPILSLTATDCPDLQRIIPSTNLDTNVVRSCDGLVEDIALSWTLQSLPDCDNSDIVSYNIYRSETEGGTFNLLFSGVVNLDTIHEGLISRAGCYYVTAVDDFGNESAPSNIECVENCPFYELPNAFSPNGDFVNDFFIPFRCPRFVRKVEFKVYNRWGDLVHQSDDDIYLRWDGTNLQGSDLPTGIYYYEAKISFITLAGPDEVQERKGTIHLFK